MVVLLVCHLNPEDDSFLTDCFDLKLGKLLFFVKKKMKSRELPEFHFAFPILIP